MKKVISILILLLVFSTATSYFYFKYRGGNESKLTLFGNVDIREVNLGFRVSGKLVKLFCDEGDIVNEGEKIACLDDEPYRNQVANVKAQVESLKARLKLRETGNRPEEVAQARALVQEREATAANAEKLFKRAEKLLASDAISVQSHENAMTSYKESEQRLKSARENLSLLESGFRSEEIEQSKADLAQAEAALATAELQLKDTVMVAPSDGVILTRAQESGAILQTGTVVFTLSLVKPVWIRAYVNEPYLGRIHPGMKVQVRTDSAHDKTYIGQIGFISSRAEFTPKTVETAELRTALVYRIRIIVLIPDEGLRQGMPVTVTISGS